MDTHSPPSKRSKTSIDPPPATPSKVTLTNWVRLNNAPLLLPRASAVQWNDYVFVLDSAGTTLLYHAKHGMWSILISCKEPLPEGLLTLALYKGEVLTASIEGTVLRYCQRASQWKECPELKVNGSNFTYSIAMMSDRSNLYAIVHCGNQEKKKNRTSSYCSVFIYSSGHRWELIGDTGATYNASFESAALAGSALYIKFGGKMYKLPIKGAELVSEQSPAKKPKREEFVQTKTPLLKGSTLHAINNELFAFGGQDDDNQPTSDVLRYNPDTDTWESAGYMRSCRYNVAVANVEVGTKKEVFVVGGSFGSKGLQISPKVHASTTTSTTSSKDDWKCSTSMAEKCAV